VNRESSAVAIYDTHTDADTAVQELHSAGVDMNRLSVVGKDYRTEDHVVGYYRADGQLKYWGRLGAFWAGIWSLLVGEAFFWMPGVGPILVGGPLATSIVGALESATVHKGLSPLGSALHGMGIPRSSVIDYESALRANKFLVIVGGANDEAPAANEILRRTQPIELAEHEGGRNS
jgi:hypothetical protein